MKQKAWYLFVLTMGALFAVALSPSLSAQDRTPARQHAHTRYKVIFTETFGGPNGHMGILGVHVLNNAGTFVGWADTSAPDPFAPGCWDGDDCFAAHAFEWQRGEITDLGTLPGSANSDTSWISANGLIAGESETGAVDPVTGGFEVHGVLWKHGKIIDLGTLDGGPVSFAPAVNSSGEVAGFSLNTIQDPYSIFGFYQTRAYRWKNGVMLDLGTLGGPDAMALRVNERGQIAGNSYTSYDPSPACERMTLAFKLTTGVFLWEKGKMIDLGTLGGTCTTIGDLNNRGQVVGSSLLEGDSVQHPFLWDRGKLTDLGTLGGNFGAALTLNEAGESVGFQTLPGNDGVFHATLWSNEHIVDLGALDKDGCSLASSINSQGQIVGLSGNCNFDEPSLRAVISDSGGHVVDLNTLIPPNSNVQLRNATVINDRGEIAAVGAFPDGNHRPVLLIPCEEHGADHDREDIDEGADSCRNTVLHSPHSHTSITAHRGQSRRRSWQHDSFSLQFCLRCLRAFAPMSER